MKKYFKVLCTWGIGKNTMTGVIGAFDSEPLAESYKNEFNEFIGKLKTIPLQDFTPVELESISYFVLEAGEVNIIEDTEIDPEEILNPVITDKWLDLWLILKRRDNK